MSAALPLVNFTQRDNFPGFSEAHDFSSKMVVAGLGLAKNKFGNFETPPAVFGYYSPESFSTQYYGMQSIVNSESAACRCRKHVREACSKTIPTIVPIRVAGNNGFLKLEGNLKQSEFIPESICVSRKHAD